MASTTSLGLLVAGLAIAGGQWVEGGSLTSLFNLSALVIVLGGTVGAVMIQTPTATFIRAFKILPWVFSPPNHSFDAISKLLVGWSSKTRQYGLLSIEQEVFRLDDPILRKGAEFLIAGIQAESLRIAIEVEIDSHELRYLEAARVFESMGGYSPTLGILGAVIGLIQVMQHLSDPSQIGLGIAVAFVATIYGIGFANLFFLPVANKLKASVYHQSRVYEMYLMGLVAMGSGDNSRMIEMKLSGYASQLRR